MVVQANKRVEARACPRSANRDTCLISAAGAPKHDRQLCRIVPRASCAQGQHGASKQEAGRRTLRTLRFTQARAPRVQGQLAPLSSDDGREGATPHPGQGQAGATYLEAGAVQALDHLLDHQCVHFTQVRSRLRPGNQSQTPTCVLDTKNSACSPEAPVDRDLAAVGRRLWAAQTSHLSLRGVPTHARQRHACLLTITRHAAIIQLSRADPCPVAHCSLKPMRTLASSYCYKPPPHKRNSAAPAPFQKAP